MVEASASNPAGWRRFFIVNGILPSRPHPVELPPDEPITPQATMHNQLSLPTTQPLRPEPFTPDAGHEYQRRIELVGEAIDDVVESYLDLTESGCPAPAEQLRRVAAAARRLSDRARVLSRTPSRLS